MNIRQELERQEHRLLNPKAAFSDQTKGRLTYEEPQEDEVHIFTGDMEPRVLSGKWVVEAEHLKIGYDKPLLELSLRIKRGQKI